MVRFRLICSISFLRRVLQSAALRRLYLHDADHHYHASFISNRRNRLWTHHNSYRSQLCRFDCNSIFNPFGHCCQYDLILLPHEYPDQLHAILAGQQNNEGSWGRECGRGQEMPRQWHWRQFQKGNNSLHGNWCICAMMINVMMTFFIGGELPCFEYHYDGIITDTYFTIWTVTYLSFI